MNQRNQIQQLCAMIVPVDRDVAAAVQARLDNKTKPRGSLGRLETLATRIGAITGSDHPPLPQKHIVVMAADHGVAQRGVSAYPPEVTAQMVANFAAGGAAINVLARQADITLTVVDMGVASPIPNTTGIRQNPIAKGTADFCEGPAMSHAEAVAALMQGATIAGDLIDAGAGIIGLGEMGIGNTTAAAALSAVLLGQPPTEVTGRGTGVDDAGLAHKVTMIEAAIQINHPDADDAMDVLAKLGGFEIAGLAGVCLAAAARHVPVVVDGFITAAAALVACRLAPDLKEYLLAAHLSVEQGHGRILDDLELEPILDLQMRLGEGTGAALAMQIIDASLRILHEMATFEDAGVSDSGK